MPEHQTIDAPELGAFRPIPYMGVIWVVAEAMKLGFRNGHPDWCNLGQGQPEVGEMSGAPPRPSEIKIERVAHALKARVRVVFEPEGTDTRRNTVRVAAPRRANRRNQK